MTKPVPAFSIGPPADDDQLLGRGRCDVCGFTGPFERVGRPTREDFSCARCQGSLRYRCQAAALVSVLQGGDASLRELFDGGGLANLDVYEPGLSGPLRYVLRERSRYVNSYLWPGVSVGTVSEGVRCEDLQALTFPDESYDLVISSDIFEHVRDPIAGFAEVHRVLRPGGSHVFTVPLRWPFSGTSTKRVDTSSGEDVHLLPPVYHGSPVDPGGSLVYTDFGMDLPEVLLQLGFRTTVHHGYRNAVTFVATRPA